MIIAIMSLSIPSYVGGVDGDYVRGIVWGCSSKDEQMTVNHWVWVRFPSSPHNQKQFMILKTYESILF